MGLFGHRSDDSGPVSARALVLAVVAPTGDTAGYDVSLLVELPGQGVVKANGTWGYDDRMGSVVPGRWVPVLVRPDDTDEIELDKERVPFDDDVAQAIAEALGAPAGPPTAESVDEWRVTLALAYAEDLIAAASLAAGQAEAIRARIRHGV